MGLFIFLLLFVALSHGFDSQPKAAIMDADNNYYVVLDVEYMLDADYSRETYLMKYNASAALLWKIKLSDHLFTVALYMLKGNFLLLGDFYDENYSYRIYHHIFSPDGNQNQVNYFSCGDRYYYFRPFDIDVETNAVYGVCSNPHGTINKIENGRLIPLFDYNIYANSPMYKLLSNKNILIVYNEYEYGNVVKSNYTVFEQNGAVVNSFVTNESYAHYVTLINLMGTDDFLERKYNQSYFGTLSKIHYSAETQNSTRLWSLSTTQDSYYYDMFLSSNKQYFYLRFMGSKNLTQHSLDTGEVLGVQTVNATFNYQNYNNLGFTWNGDIICLVFSRWIYEDHDIDRSGPANYCARDGGSVTNVLTISKNDTWMTDLSIKNVCGISHTEVSSILSVGSFLIVMLIYFLVLAVFNFPRKINPPNSAYPRVVFVGICLVNFLSFVGFVSLPFTAFGVRKTCVLPSCHLLLAWLVICFLLYFVDCVMICFSKAGSFSIVYKDLQVIGSAISMLGSILWIISFSNVLSFTASLLYSIYTLLMGVIEIMVVYRIFNFNLAQAYVDNRFGVQLGRLILHKILLFFQFMLFVAWMFF
eukprot:TRINITY_DN7596_c0_g1_i2.p1 TRINITY_DN7596_c0_g1~~TRINITY_DN7596_c0_g1_i2.p1  ORF type:complete len:587 (-),score=24.28 TRINITY_DN7596_c0_g1_i2:32-1792(-)